ncbi:MAG: PAS domain S-box protein, partial [Syntrophomonadaceae bacterium]|nr:PAS domain S-box protein [Syntrophomonadaceae bacterium]
MGYEGTADGCSLEQDGYPAYYKDATKVKSPGILAEHFSMTDKKSIILLNSLKHLLKESPLMMCVLQGIRLIYYNSSFKSGLSYDDKTLSTINFLDLVHPKYKRLVQDQLIIIKANPSYSFHNEIKMLSLTGKEIWVDLSTRSLDIQGNKLIEVTAYKIEHYMHTIEELRQRRDRLYSIIEDMSELVEIEDHNYQITFANNAYCCYFEKTHEELLQTIGLDLIHEDDRQSIMDAVCSMNLYDPTVYAESRVIKANGEIGWMSWTAHGFFDESGNLIAHQAVGRDITELKEYEEELRLSEARYRGIVEDQSELIQRILPDLTIIFVNDAYCRFFHCQKEDLIGKKCTQHIYNEDQALVETTIKKLSPENQFIIYAERVITQERQVSWIEWTARGFFTRSGELKEIQVVGHDITDRKMAERGLQKAHDELELRVKERTFELSKVNKELGMLNNNMQSLISNMADGVIIVDAEGGVQNLNPILEKTCGTAYPEILEKIKRDILEEKNGYVMNMLKNKQAFKDVVIDFSTSRDGYHFLMSGTPLENIKDAVNRGFLIISPMKEVHNLVNRFNGARARFSFEDIVTDDPLMQETIDYARQAATSNGTVLITGESGTGKEMFAQ